MYGKKRRPVTFPAASETSQTSGGTIIGEFPEFPHGIFARIKNVDVAPGQYPTAGDEAEFDVDRDRFGRPWAVNVKLANRRAPMPVEPQSQ